MSTGTATWSISYKISFLLFLLWNSRNTGQRYRKTLHNKGNYDTNRKTLIIVSEQNIRKSKIYGESPTCNHVTNKSPSAKSNYIQLKCPSITNPPNKPNSRRKRSIIQRKTRIPNLPDDDAREALELEERLTWPTRGGGKRITGDERPVHDCNCDGKWWSIAFFYFVVANDWGRRKGTKAVRVK